MSFLGAASREKLSTCHPDLQRLILAVSDRVNFSVICGHRTEAEQNKAVAEKNSRTRWPNSKHNSFPSEAVDVWPYAEGIHWEDVPAAARLMGYIQATADAMGIKIRLGMDWDMDWRSAGKDPGETFYDGPHIELVF